MAAYAEGVELADRTVSSSESEDEEERQDRGEEAHIKQGELRISHARFAYMHLARYTYVHDICTCGFVQSCQRFHLESYKN